MNADSNYNVELVSPILTYKADIETVQELVRRLSKVGGFVNASTGIPTPGGKKVWSVSTIMSILQSEKYKGDALLQKEYTMDYLTKKKKKNNGNYPVMASFQPRPTVPIPNLDLTISPPICWHDAFN